MSNECYYCCARYIELKPVAMVYNGVTIDYEYVCPKCIEERVGWYE